MALLYFFENKSWLSMQQDDAVLCNLLNPLTAAIGRPFFGQKSPALELESWSNSLQIQQVF